jgi:hypothetical protein
MKCRQKMAYKFKVDAGFKCERFHNNCCVEGKD